MLAAAVLNRDVRVARNNVLRILAYHFQIKYLEENTLRFSTKSSENFPFSLDSQ